MHRKNIHLFLKKIYLSINFQPLKVAYKVKTGLSSSLWQRRLGLFTKFFANSYFL